MDNSGRKLLIRQFCAIVKGNSFQGQLCLWSPCRIAPVRAVHRTELMMLQEQVMDAAPSYSHPGAGDRALR